MKRCTKCGLSVDEGVLFNKDKQKKDGLSSSCKKCHSEYQKQYFQSKDGKEKKWKYQQTEKYKKAKNKYQQTTKCKEARRKRRQSLTAKEAQKRYRQSGKDKEAQKKYSQTEKGKERTKRHYKKNRTSCCLSAAIRRSLKGNKNGRHWENLTGWTLQQFKKRFAQLLKPEMTWENHGTVWEVDHIKPLSVHNITSIDCTDFKRAWKLSNLQPLFKEENRSKQNKLETHFQPTLF